MLDPVGGVEKVTNNGYIYMMTVLKYFSDLYQVKKDEDSLSDFVVDESESEDDDWRVRFLFRFKVGIKYINRVCGKIFEEYLIQRMNRRAISLVCGKILFRKVI
jgi:hypothetical protein